MRIENKRILFCRLSLMLLKYTTKDVVTTVASFSPDMYPLLVCLSVHQGQIDVLSVINGTMTRDETHADLLESRKKFDHRTELPHSKSSNKSLIFDENQSIPRYVLKPCTEYSPTIQKITKDFEKYHMHIVRIDQVENDTWFKEYINQKQIIDAQLGRDKTEQLLFHGCSRSAAENIIQYGFDQKLIGMHGNTFELKSNNIQFNYFRHIIRLWILFFI